MKKQTSDRSGQYWSKEEEINLFNEFKSMIDLSEISKRHCRSRGAIESRASKIALNYIISDQKYIDDIIKYLHNNKLYIK